MPLVIISLVITACQPAAPAQETTGQAQATSEVVTETQAQAPEQTEPSTTAGEFAEIPREQTVIFENPQGRSANPENFNPHIPGNYLSNGFWQIASESLFYLNYESGDVIPWLAESYEYNEGYTEVTIKLRDGVKWSDGVPFTADDVVFTINMLKENTGLDYSSDVNKWVQDIEAVDDHTVKITLTGPNPRFIIDMFSVRVWYTLLIIPKHIWEGQDPTKFNNYDPEKGWPVVTGAYKLVRSTETETIWDRRDDWWGAETGFRPLPAPKRAIWTLAGTEEIRAAMGANNELDVLYTVGRGTLEVLKSRNPNIITWTETLPLGYVDPCPRDLQINNMVPPFDNPDVRWAVNHAINRDQLIEIAYEGTTVPQTFDMPAYAGMSSFFERNQASADKILVHDLAKTESLMTGAGFTKDNDGFWVGSDGKKIVLDITAPAGDSDNQKMLPILVEQLRTAGFDASGKALEWSVFADGLVRGTSTAFLHNLCASVIDPAAALDSFNSRYSAPLGEPAAGGRQGSRYANPEYDEIVNKLSVMSASDPEFNKLADEAAAIWVRDLPVVPLVQAMFIIPYNTTYWTNWPTADNNYFFPLAHWWVSGNILVQNIKPAK